MIDLYNGTSFWSSPSEYKPGPKLTENQIEEIEALLQVRLPLELRDLYIAQNGGSLNYPYVLFEDGDAAIIPFIYELDKESGVGLSQVFIEECRLPKGLVILAGDFQTWVALDYRNKSEPSVVYLLQTDEGLWEEHKLALTFQQFLAKLFRKNNN